MRLFDWQFVFQQIHDFFSYIFLIFIPHLFINLSYNFCVYLDQFKGCIIFHKFFKYFLSKHANQDDFSKRSQIEAVFAKLAKKSQEEICFFEAVSIYSAGNTHRFCIPKFSLLKLCHHLREIFCYVPVRVIRKYI